jgi:hypothetical protein
MGEVDPGEGPDISGHLSLGETERFFIGGGAPIRSQATHAGRPER